MVSKVEIEKFCEAMNNKMKRNQPVKGDSWKTCSILYLWDRLFEEIMELNMADKSCFTDFGEELVDIANFAMMIWNRYNDGTGGNCEKDRG